MPAKAKKVDTKKGTTGKVGKDDLKKVPVKQEEPEETEKELLLKEE